MNLLEYFKKTPTLHDLCRGPFWPVNGPLHAIHRNFDDVLLLHLRNESGEEYLYGPVTVKNVQMTMSPVNLVIGYWDVTPVKVSVS